MSRTTSPILKASIARPPRLLLYQLFNLGLVDDALLGDLWSTASHDAWRADTNDFTDNTKIPDYFSTLGGLAAFGANGFLIGPIIAAMFISLWSVFSKNQKIGMRLSV